MRKLLIACMAFAAIAVLGSTSGATAGEKASTSELPAALQALGVDESRIVTQQEAEQIRGEAFDFNFQLSFVGGGITVDINAAVAGGSILFAVNTGGIALAIQ